MKFTKEGVNRSVKKLQMASGHDVTIKLYQHHVIERHARLVDAINVLNIFCGCYTVISAVSQHT